MTASTVGTAGTRSAEWGVRKDGAESPDFGNAEAFIMARGICGARQAESMRFPEVSRRRIETRLDDATRGG